MRGSRPLLGHTLFLPTSILCPSIFLFPSFFSSQHLSLSRPSVVSRSLFVFLCLFFSFSNHSCYCFAGRETETRMVHLHYGRAGGALLPLRTLIKPAFASQSRSIQFVQKPMKMSRSAIQKPFAANKRRFSPGTWYKERKKNNLPPFAFFIGPKQEREILLFNHDPRGSTLMFKSYKIHPKGNFSPVFYGTNIENIYTPQRNLSIVHWIFWSKRKFPYFSRENFLPLLLLIFILSIKDSFEYIFRQNNPYSENIDLKKQIKSTYRREKQKSTFGHVNFLLIDLFPSCRENRKKRCERIGKTLDGFYFRQSKV